MELTGTHLRYLLHMYEMSQREDEMRLTEIAKALHVKKASVARIVSIFREKQLVDQQRYGKLHLTAYGNEVAALYAGRVYHVADCLMQTGAVCDAPTGDGCGVPLIAGAAGVLRRCRRGCGNLMRTSESDAYCLGSISRTARFFFC